MFWYMVEISGLACCLPRKTQNTPFSRISCLDLLITEIERETGLRTDVVVLVSCRQFPNRTLASLAF